MKALIMSLLIAVSGAAVAQDQFHTHSTGPKTVKMKTANSHGQTNTVRRHQAHAGQTTVRHIYHRAHNPRHHGHRHYKTRRMHSQYSNPHRRAYRTYTTRRVYREAPVMMAPQVYSACPCAYPASPAVYFSFAI